ncbi:MAG: HD domain-containing protein [Lachnospiraceae bacterium]|nr:HD domain-containing protein [Lachnospiraceae bacterium]
METKLESVALQQSHEKWEQLTKRENDIYQRRDDIRSPFARDYTRVLHSLAYRRLKHKTQVFFNAAGNDHICTRIEHVSHVDSVSNTIAKYLGLNEELTKAIALSHDLGHAPFGHEGERIISDLTKKYLDEKFWHEKNGVYFVDNVELLEDNERNLQNLNLTYAVRDGIISHCGEIDQNGIKPREELISLDDFQSAGQYQAATWEGCVVKLADKIAYLGRDIEDAIRLGYLDTEQQNTLREMAKINNEKAINTTVIMHNMIIDLCENSSIENGLCLSETMSQQLDDVKDFNYKYIYKHKRMKPFMEYSRLILNQIFELLLSYYRKEDTIYYLDSIDFDKKSFVKGFAEWLVQYCEMEFEKLSWAKDISDKCMNKKIYGTLADEKRYIRAVIDFMAGMTDVYAMKAFNEMLEC